MFLRWIAKRSIFGSLQGLLSAVGRVALCSGYLGFYIFLWFFLLLASFVFFAALFQRAPSPQEAFTLLILTLGLLALPTLRVVRWMTQRVEQRPFNSVGLLWLSWHSFKELLSGIALGTVIVCISFLHICWSGTIQVSWNPIGLTPSAIWMLLLLTLGWLGVAFWEELYFRGYLLQTWASGIGFAPAVLITSASFSMMHVATYGMAPLVLLDLALIGILLAVLYLKTKSLWSPIGLHFANNFLLAHLLPVPLEQDIRLPLLKINDQAVQFEAPRLLFQVKLAEGESLMNLLSWESLGVSLIVYVLLALFIWKIPWLSPHPSIEALWQQYIRPAQPWARLRGWLTNRPKA